MKRFKLSGKKSRRLFSKTGALTHRKNNLNPMRGGIRL